MNEKGGEIQERKGKVNPILKRLLEEEEDLKEDLKKKKEKKRKRARIEAIREKREFKMKLLTKSQKVDYTLRHFIG